jgi:CheY-like chemotaxis protein
LTAMATNTDGNISSKPMKVLIAEDEHDIALIYKTALENRNHEVTTTANGEDCLKTYHEQFQCMRFGEASPYYRGYNINGNNNPFDVVILDHKMPRINGLEVAKEILAVNPHQRIIFASAYVRKTLEESVKQLKQVVELIQKPFNLNELIDTVEDKEIYSELRKLNVDIDIIKAINPTHEQIMDLLSRLVKIHKFKFKMF